MGIIDEITCSMHIDDNTNVLDQIFNSRTLSPELETIANQLERVMARRPKYSEDIEYLLCYSIILDTKSYTYTLTPISDETSIWPKFSNETEKGYLMSSLRTLLFRSGSRLNFPLVQDPAIKLDMSDLNANFYYNIVKSNTVYKESSCHGPNGVKYGVKIVDTTNSFRKIFNPIHLDIKSVAPIIKYINGNPTEYINFDIPVPLIMKKVWDIVGDDGIQGVVNSRALTDFEEELPSALLTDEFKKNVNRFWHTPSNLNTIKVSKDKSVVNISMMRSAILVDNKIALWPIAICFGAPITQIYINTSCIANIPSILPPEGTPQVENHLVYSVAHTAPLKLQFSLKSGLPNDICEDELESLVTGLNLFISNTVFKPFTKDNISKVEFSLEEITDTTFSALFQSSPTPQQLNTAGNSKYDATFLLNEPFQISCTRKPDVSIRGVKLF